MKSIEVVAAVIIQNSTVFCAQRPDSGETAKKWEFPGGKIEVGESHEGALIREIQEEFDVRITVGPLVLTVTHQYQTFLLIMHAYQASIVEGYLTPQEHIDTRFLTSRELYTVDWAPADIPIVKAVERRLLHGSQNEPDLGSTIRPQNPQKSKR